jgi:phage repressor protein C with HTH and peptisase S24 domain
MKPARLVRKRGDFPLSGESLTELMRAVLARGKPFRFRARGFSMSPFINDGDVVTVTPLAGSRPRTGEIVAFLHPATGKAAVHRIVRQESGGYHLKGDNSSETDGGLPLERILGIVSRVERDGKGPRVGRRGGAVIASLSRSGLLTKAVGAARRAGVRRTGRT